MDPYDVLGVSRNADSREIKKAFQELAKKYHPDKQSSEATPTERAEATDHFRSLSSAYQLLIDDKTRQQYDIEYKTNEITEKWIINDIISLCDLNCDTSEGVYWYECRCGGMYNVSVEHVKETVRDKGNELIVGCNTCSLHIKIDFTE